MDTWYFEITGSENDHKSLAFTHLFVSPLFYT